MAADAATAGQRPPLRGGADPIGEIRTVLKQRAAAYARAADLQIDTDRLSVDEICRRIADWMASGAEAPARHLPLP
jgi:shikimate kinase